MKRYAGLLAVAAFAAACGSEQLNDNSMTGPTLSPTTVMHVAPGVTCSDEQIKWKTKNYSTSARSFLVDWYAAAGVSTYEVEVSYSRDGLEPKRLLRTFHTNRSNATLPDPEHGGRYYIRVRITHNDCGDVSAAWSTELVVYVGGDSSGASGGSGPQPPPGDDDDEDDEEEEEDSCEAEDEDHDSGHGNNCDHDDEDNPGQGND